jgi:hypothetical protein
MNLVNELSEDYVYIRTKSNKFSVKYQFSENIFIPVNLELKSVRA